MRISLRFEKRENVSRVLRVLVPVLCVLLALLVGGIFMRWQGFDPVKAYQKLFKNAFGNWKNFSGSVLYAIPLIFCSLGVSVAFRMSLSNIGAEGQYAMGAIAATGVALFMPGIPEGLTLPAMILASFVLGGLWAVVSTLPKVLWNVSETLVTLMLNYVALKYVSYLCCGPWRTIENTVPRSAYVPEYARFSTIFGAKLHTGLFLALAVMLAVYLFYRHTTLGYQMEVIGKNAKAAQYAGIPVKRNILLAMFFSGGLAGLAGVAQVAGSSYYLIEDISGGAGYTAIVIAYMAHLNPFVAVLVSILFGGLAKGSIALQLMQISPKVATMLQGLILLFVLGGEIFVQNKISFKITKKAAKEAAE